MTRFLAFVLLPAITALGTQIPSTSVPSDTSQVVTFNKDVLPILQKNCQVCHRPGEVAPMSFITYESTRPWAKAIKAAVVSRKMPPWFADPHFGDFRNNPTLSAADVSTLAAWADSGAREGDPEDKPSPVKWVGGWRIQPDVVVSMPAPHRVRARGEGEIKEFLVPNPFIADTWVSSIEIRPGDPSVVHHVIVQVPEFDAPAASGWGGFLPEALREALLKDTRNGVEPQPRRGGSYPGGSNRALEQIKEIGTFTTMEAVYAPGSPPLDFRFHNSAKRIRGGLPIRIEVHYTPNGRETTDQTMIGFTLAEPSTKRRFVMMAPASLVDTEQPIPAGASNFERSGELTFTHDAELVWFMPHMHLRGKDMTFRLIYPNGREETVLSAKFNFQWQLGYEVEAPIKIPRGTKMVVTAHYDNSANNPYNPDPKKDAQWGELTSQEMMLPWFGVVVNREVDPEMIAAYRPGGFDGPDSDSPPLVNPQQRLRLPTPPFSPNGSRSDILKAPIFAGQEK